MPLFIAKKASTVVNLMTKMLKEIDPEWTEKLLGMTTDYENLMLGHLSGIQKRLNDFATTNLVFFTPDGHYFQEVFLAFHEKESGNDVMNTLVKLIGVLREGSWLEVLKICRDALV